MTPLNAMKSCPPFVYAIFDTKKPFAGIINFDKSHPDKHIVIPSHIDDIPVEFIGEAAFSGSDIVSVILPETLRTIRVRAFFGCRDLKEINIPDSVEYVHGNAFGFCVNLERVRWSSNAKYIQPHTFYNSSSLKEISNIDNVKEIRKWSFACSGLETFMVPEKCVFIKDRAFSQCKNLNYIRIPISIKSIDDNVFEGSENVKLDSQRNSRVKEWAESQGIPIIDSKLNSFLKNINEDIKIIR